MKSIPHDAIITFFDGFSKSCYNIYLADTGGLALSHEKACAKWIMNSKKMFEYLDTRYEFSYDPAEMQAISHDISMTIQYEEMVAYFWKICWIFTEKDIQINSQANQSKMFWEISEEATIAYFLGLSWLMNRDTPNREKKISDFLLLVKDHMKLVITKERILEVVDYFLDDQKLEEIRLRMFDIMEIGFVIRTPKQVKHD